MRRRALYLCAVTLILAGSGRGQAPIRSHVQAPIQSDGANSDKPHVIINPVFATGMKCDGVTDDSTALQNAVNSAALPGLGNAAVIMPSGTCIVNPAAGITINSSVWLQGAGRFGTTLKRKNSSAGSPLILLNSNGVTLSDFAIDGNKGGSGIVTPTDSVATGTPLANIAIERMRFVNSTSSDIASYVSGDGNLTTNWLISDNDFENGGNPFSSCSETIGCANIFLRQPYKLRVQNNRSENADNFALFSSIPGGGLVDVGGNIINSVGGFAIALGGGVVGSTGAHVHDNTITSSSTDHQNLIDLAFWNDFTVDHNILYHRGIATACIADFPPANHGEVDSNVMYVSPLTGVNVGIGMGGSDIGIMNNYVEGAAGAGISIAVSYVGVSRGIRVIGNVTKNNNHLNVGHHAGIELFLAPGGPNMAGLTDVIIQGNHSYDDQPVKTQGYGIGIALYGQRTGFSNILMENNDVTGNLVAGIFSSATDISGFVYRNNLGFNPVGPISSPAIPAPGAGPVLNNSGLDVDVYITSGAFPVSVAINGVAVPGATIPAGGGPAAPIHLPTNQTITLSYAHGGNGAPPSWQWVAN
jgi:hypothetical protein